MNLENTNDRVQLDTYIKIKRDLEKLVTEYLNKYSGREIIKFINEQRHSINYGDYSHNNRFIRTDYDEDEIVDEIKRTYTSPENSTMITSLNKEIGTTDEFKQYDGINRMALAMVMSNRVAKWYERNSRDNRNSANEKAKYKRQASEYYLQKREYAIKLISSIYIYNEVENLDDFYYGHTVDEENIKRGKKSQDGIVVDLPSYGQVAVHFPSKNDFESVKAESVEMVKSILKKKLDLQQLTEEEYEKHIEKVNSENIFPEYTGILYEKSSAIPIVDCNGELEDATDKYGPMGDITEKYIKDLAELNIYNSREIYYFALKNEFPKSKLELLSKLLQERDNIKQTINVKKMGRECLKQTTWKERDMVNRYEIKSEEKQIDNTKEK